MSHIAIKLNGVYLATGEDTAIDLEDANPYFNDQSETMSLPFTVPLDGNRAAFGNVECIENDDNLRSIENMRMDVEVDGILLRSGKAGSIEDQSLADSVALQMVSAVFSLDDYLDGVRCRDVDVDDDILIGETIGNIKIDLSYKLSLKVYYQYPVTGGCYKTLSTDRHEVVDMDASFPALGFSNPFIAKTFDGELADGYIDKKPTISKSTINVTTEYTKGSVPFCNARVCYMHYDVEGNGESSDKIKTSINDQSEYDRYNPYLMLEADRPASGICFYVLYFLQKLFDRFKEDGIAYDDTEIYKLNDLRRLAFFTTHCKFNIKPRSVVDGQHHTISGMVNINNWFASRNINTKLSIDNSIRESDISQVIVRDQKITVGEWVGSSPLGGLQYVSRVGRIYYEASNIEVNSVTADVMNMYANSLNFPDSDAKTIIDSLWASFGIRFYLDQQTRLVKPRFIRDILRSQEEAIVFPCIVISVSKQTHKVTGFRMQYSGQSDKQQREDNITLGTTDYDTTYDYEDYRNLNLSLTYSQIITQAYDTNMSCYVDFHTGNLYRVKIDHDAEERNQYHPVVFEVGQLHGVEIGDCSSANTEFVEEISSSFQPIIFNDINFIYETKASTAEDFLMSNDETNEVFEVSSDKQNQILAAFISEDMWHENVARVIKYPLGNSHVSITLDAEIKTTESFDVSSSDDGDSPLQSLDWGLAVALMRGGGSEAHIDYYDYNYDMFGNCKYRMVAGSDYGISLDSIDNYGQVYDYNGDLPGIGSGDESITPEQAASSIRRIFRSSNANLFSELQHIDAEHITTVTLNDLDGENYCYLLTNVKADGSVLSNQDFSDYLNWLVTWSKAHNINIMALDGTLQDFKLIIGKYKDSIVAGEYRELLLQLANVYYSGEPGKITCPIPEGESIDYNSSADGRISLKIRSYIEAPEDMIGPNGEEIKKGTPLCDPQVKNRGLFDQFMSDYAYLRLHGKHVDIDVQCEVAALTNIQWHRRYRFGDYVGWINKIKTHITAEKGIESVTVELLVL